MAIPKIFVSSTYYDLKHVRTDIEVFIKSLGYEAVLHERNKITYDQNSTLEDSCYREIDNCEILVCIIGNKFGTESHSNNYSITMEELNTAIKKQKKVYTFIQKDVSIENRTYIANKSNKDFVSVAVDDIRVHEFISDLKQTVTNFPITDFEGVNDIIDSLRLQFAGLFQNLLQRESSLTESKTVYDLNDVSRNMQKMIDELKETNDETLNVMNGTLFVLNPFILKLLEVLSLKDEYRVIITTKKSLFSYLNSMGFKLEENPFEIVFSRSIGNNVIQNLCVSDKIFDKNEIILRNCDSETLNNSFKLTENKNETTPIIDEDDLPF